jgi:hypothetical protein
LKILPPLKRRGWNHSSEHNKRNGAVRPVVEQSVVITVSVFTVTVIAYERRNKNIGGTMSKKQVSFCGYRCDLCPAYAKNVDTLAKRTTVRKGWNTFFGFDVPEERILCVGCSEKGGHLDTECPVRPCALSNMCRIAHIVISLNPVKPYGRVQTSLMRQKRNILVRFQKRSMNCSFVPMKEEKN